MDFERRQRYLYPRLSGALLHHTRRLALLDGFVFARGLIGSLSAYTSSYTEMRHDL
jgi:hypothetical protein